MTDVTQIDTSGETARSWSTLLNVEYIRNVAKE